MPLTAHPTLETFELADVAGDSLAHSIFLLLVKQAIRDFLRAGLLGHSVRFRQDEQTTQGRGQVGKVLLGKFEPLDGPAQGHILQKGDGLTDLIVSRLGTPLARPIRVGEAHAQEVRFRSLRQPGPADRQRLVELHRIAPQPLGAGAVMFHGLERRQARLQSREEQPMSQHLFWFGTLDGPGNLSVDPPLQQDFFHPNAAGTKLIQTASQCPVRLVHVAQRASNTFDVCFEISGLVMRRLPIETSDQHAQPLQVASQTFDDQGALQRAETGLGLEVSQGEAVLAQPLPDASGQHLAMRRGGSGMVHDLLDSLPQAGEPPRDGPPFGFRTCAGDRTVKRTP